MARMIQNGTSDRVSIALLNTENIKIVKAFLDEWGDMSLDTFTKTCQAGIQFLKRKIDGFNFS